MDTAFITLSDSLPVLCIQGTADATVPYISGHPYSYPIFPIVYGSLPVTTRLTNLHVRNKLVALIGKGHEPEGPDPTINDTMNNEGREFLWQIFKPLPPAITGPDTICYQKPATYSVPHIAGSKYCWQLTGNGVITRNVGDTINVLWSDSGIVTVYATETNYMGAQADPVSYRTLVAPRVKASFTFGVYQLQCRFVNTSKYESSVYWNFDNGDTSSAFYPVEPYTPGTYQVTEIAYNEQCAAADTFISTVVVDTCPFAHFTYQEAGLNGFFYGDTSNTVLYDWNFGDGSMVNVVTPNVLHQYQHGGNYSVILSEINSQGCKNSDTVVVSIFNASVDDINAGSVSVICNLFSSCDVKLTEPGLWNMEVYDILGQLWMHRQISGDYVLQTSQFRPGVYLIKLSCGNQSLVTKLVKQ